MSHLTSDELIDAIEGLLPSEQQAHLSSCLECQQQLDELASVLSEAKQVSVPEPSPLFWQHFSTRVNEGIDNQAAGAWPQWLRWQVLLPLGAVAMIILALMIAVPKSSMPGDAPVALVAPVAPDAPASDDNWGTLVALVGELDLETASAAGVIQPGFAEQAVVHLTREEQQELSRLLQAELTRAKS
jgi:hypothetical protein